MTVAVDPAEMTRVDPGTLAPDAFAAATSPVAVAVGGRAMQVLFDDVEAAVAFEHKYRAFHRGGEPAVTVRCARDGDRTLFANGDYVKVWSGPRLPAFAVAFLADAFAWSEFFRTSADFVSLHAAALRYGTGVVALAADSTGGKSTTAMACARAGMTMLSDERCIIRNGGVVPFPRAISLREGGLALLRADRVSSPDPVGARLRAHPGASWTEAGFDELFGAAPSDEEAPLRALVVMDGFGGAPVLEPIAAAAAVPRIGRWMQSSAGGFDRIARLLSVLRAVPCYALTAGSPHATAQTIAEMMARC